MSRHEGNPYKVSTIGASISKPPKTELFSIIYEILRKEKYVGSNKTYMADLITLEITKAGFRKVKALASQESKGGTK